MSLLIIVIEDEASRKHDLARWMKFTAAYLRQVSASLPCEVMQVLLSSSDPHAFCSVSHEYLDVTRSISGEVERVAALYNAEYVAVLPLSTPLRGRHALAECLRLCAEKNMPVISAQPVAVAGSQGRKYELIRDDAIACVRADQTARIWDDSEKWLYQWSGSPVLNMDWCASMYGDEFIASAFDLVMGNKLKTNFL